MELPTTSGTVGIEGIIPPLQGSALMGALLTQAVGLGFVSPPRWGSPAHTSRPSLAASWRAASQSVGWRKALRCLSIEVQQHAQLRCAPATVTFWNLTLGGLGWGGSGSPTRVTGPKTVLENRERNLDVLPNSRTLIARYVLLYISWRNNGQTLARLVMQIPKMK